MMKTYLILLSGVILWGMYPIFAHYFALSIDPLFLVSAGSLVSSVPFIFAQIAKKKAEQFFLNETLRTLLPVALFAAFGHILLFTGTKLTSGTNTGLLLQVEPVYSLILGIIFFREVIEKKRIGATLIMILGAMIIVYKGGASLNAGDLFVLLTPLMYQLSHVLAKRLLDRGYEVSFVLAGRQFLAGVMTLFLTLGINRSFSPLFSLENLAVASYLGLYLSLVSFIWYRSIKIIPVSVASSFLPLTAVVALLGSAFFLREIISPRQYVGFVFIVGGMLWLASLYSRTRKNSATE